MVVVCEPITLLLTTLFSPEHWNRYSVMNPLGSVGGFQVSVTLFEVIVVIKIISGADPGSRQRAANYLFKEELKTNTYSPHLLI